jgi:hypothetical protein
MTKYECHRPVVVFTACITITLTRKPYERTNEHVFKLISLSIDAIMKYGDPFKINENKQTIDDQQNSNIQRLSIGTIQKE